MGLQDGGEVGMMCESFTDHDRGSEAAWQEAHDRMERADILLAQRIRRIEGEPLTTRGEHS